MRYYIKKLLKKYSGLQERCMNKYLELFEIFFKRVNVCVQIIIKK